MLVSVTNKARSLRGFATLDRGIVPVEPGANAVLDLADHALHRAWATAGEVVVAPLSDKDAKAARKRLEAEAVTAREGRAQALAELPVAPHPL
jgi:hypothetical protein